MFILGAITHMAKKQRTDSAAETKTQPKTQQVVSQILKTLVEDPTNEVYKKLPKDKIEAMIDAPRLLKCAGFTDQGDYLEIDSSFDVEKVKTVLQALEKELSSPPPPAAAATKYTKEERLYAKKYIGNDDPKWLEKNTFRFGNRLVARALGGAPGDDDAMDVDDAPPLVDAPKIPKEGDLVDFEGRDGVYRAKKWDILEDEIEVQKDGSKGGRYKKLKLSEVTVIEDPKKVTPEKAPQDGSNSSDDETHNGMGDGKAEWLSQGDASVEENTPLAMLQMLVKTQMPESVPEDKKYLLDTLKDDGDQNDIMYGLLNLLSKELGDLIQFKDVRTHREEALLVPTVEGQVVPDYYKENQYPDVAHFRPLNYHNGKFDDDPKVICDNVEKLQTALPIAWSHILKLEEAKAEDAKTIQNLESKISGLRMTVQQGSGTTNEYVRAGDRETELFELVGVDTGERLRAVSPILGKSGSRASTKAGTLLTPFENHKRDVAAGRFPGKEAYTDKIGGDINTKPFVETDKDFNTEVRKEEKQFKRVYTKRVMDHDISVETAVNEINSFVTQDMYQNHASATSTAVGKLINNYGVNGRKEDEHSLKGIQFEGEKTKKLLLKMMFTLDAEMNNEDVNTPVGEMLLNGFKILETYLNVMHHDDEEMKGLARWNVKLLEKTFTLCLKHAHHAKKEAKAKYIIKLLEKFKEELMNDEQERNPKNDTTNDWGDDDDLYGAKMDATGNEVASHRAKPSHNAKASSAKPQPSLPPPDEPGVRRCGICRGELRLSDEIDYHMMGCETLFHRSCNTNHHKIATVPAVFNCYACRRKSRITSRAPNEWEDEIDEDYSRIYRNVNVMECADLFDHPNNVHTYN